MKRFVQNSLIYTALQFVQKGAGFLLLPIYTSCLSPGDYGTVGLVTAYAGFINIFAFYVMDGACIRYEYVYADAAGRKTTWGSGLSFVLASGLTVVAVVALLRRFLVTPFLPEIPFVPFVGLGLLAVLCGGPFALYSALLRARQAGRAYAVLSVLNFVSTVGLTLLFVIPLRAGAAGVLAATAIAAFLSSAASLLGFRREGISLARERWGELARYSTPLLPHLVAGWAMLLVDRLFIHRFIGPAAVGVYMAGFQIGGLVAYLASAIHQAYSPWFFEEVGKGPASFPRVERVAETIATVCGYAAFAVSLFAPELLAVMTRGEFRNGWVVVPGIAFSSAFGGFYNIFVNPLFLRKTVWVPIVTIASALVGVALNVVWVPRFGMAGAAGAALASGFASSAIALFLSSRKESVTFRWRRMYAQTFLLLIASTAVFAFHGGGAGAVAGKAAFFAAVSAALVVANKKTLRALRDVLFPGPRP